MGSVKKLNEPDYVVLTKKAKLASGDEFVKVGEKGLPTLLDNLSASGINIVPLSNRCDDGRCGTQAVPEILSRTEKEFVALKYNYKNWLKPGPLQNPNGAVSLQDKNPEDHGTYKYRNGIIYCVAGKDYTIRGETPHKSIAIVGLVNKLKEEGPLPSAIYFTDGEKTINETSKDLEGVDLGIPVYLLKYTQPPAFLTPGDLKEFYIHRLGENFQKYESQFNEAFSGK